MTQLKYEFVPGDEITIAPGRMVKRIRALTAIAAPGITPGQLGGYIEGEKNLTRVSGNAWVSGNARVSGDARVSGNAHVSGNARVYGDAHVSGDARVFGDARVYGDAHVSGNARVYGDAHVSGNARVSGDAHVSGNAHVSGDARVSGNAHVSGNAWVYGNKVKLSASKVGTENGTLTVFNGKDGIVVNRGCFIGSIDEFLAASEAKHNDATHLEYRLLIEVAYSRITRALRESK